ncbi:MAG TPA: energy-coupling factor transporter ATPase [Firmicutes bacterium]|nr:energy-coupling factor transporter ATPase [Bacillota bacterium]
MAVEIKDLTYVYSPKSPFEKKALDRVSLTVDDGDFFGIIGHTGSGKSTLISHLNALTRVQPKLNISSVLRVCGIDLTAKKPDLKALREKVGMVFQYPEYQLFADTVADDVAYGPKNLGLDEAEIDVRVREAIGKVGLDYNDVAQRSPFELSGGQKRRAAIAGVIAMRPELLILDEPTAGLDPRGKSEILDLLREIKRTCPTIIMVSHNMDEVAACCNKVAVLGEGKVMGVFTPAELFSRRELIHSLGLELPTVTELAAYLADSGIPVNPAVLTEEELILSLAHR